MSNNTTTAQQDLDATRRRLADCLARLDAAMTRLAMAMAKWGAQ